MTSPNHDPLLYPPPSLSNNTKWGPYSNARDFSATMALVLIVLVCTLALALALNAAIRFLLRRRRSQFPLTPGAIDAAADPEKHKAGKQLMKLVETLPRVVFSGGMRLGGTGAECAICLSEFVEGDGIRVFPACKHGFHVKCIEGWLSSRSSCPTCRSSCSLTVETAGKARNLAEQRLTLDEP